MTERPLNPFSPAPSIVNLGLLIDTLASLCEYWASYWLIRHKVTIKHILIDT